MRTLLLSFAIVGLLCGCSSKSDYGEARGIVCDATMNTVTIVTDDNDTLSFSTVDTDKSGVDGLLLGDTAEITYRGRYEKGMGALPPRVPRSPRIFRHERRAEGANLWPFLLSWTNILRGKPVGRQTDGRRGRKAPVLPSQSLKLRLSLIWSQAQTTSCRRSSSERSPPFMSG